MTSGRGSAGLALAWQDVLMAARPNRLALRDLAPPEGLPQLRLLMLRNHTTESVQMAAAPFLAYAGFSAEWTVSDYDDSLTAVDLAAGKDAVIIWLDHTRYGLASTAFPEWLVARVRAVRAIADAPVLVVGPEPGANPLWSQIAETLAGLAGVHPVALDAVAGEMSGSLVDPARAEAMGTRFSRDAQLLIARRLGLQWLPAAMGFRRKALAVDLDQTLYRGVLGEDGIDGIVLEPGHVALQEALLALRRDGLMLTLVSKNDRRDVEALFAARKDFPLQLSDLVTWRANWEPKAVNIASMAAELNIAPDSFLLIDDNPGELSAAAAIPGLGLMRASQDASQTVRQLGLIPGLMAFAVTETDRLRAVDMAARRLRQLHPGDDGFLAGLATTITLAPDPAAQRQRLAAVTVKTNQFNLALARLTEAQIDNYLQAADRCVVALSLKDQLSDSGNVGAIYLRRMGQELHVEELCISCRALGRGLEDAMIGSAIKLASDRLGFVPTRICFHACGGPRNQPALAWLERLSGEVAPSLDQKGVIGVDPETVAALGSAVSHAVSISVDAG